MGRHWRGRFNPNFWICAANQPRQWHSHRSAEFIPLHRETFSDRQASQNDGIARAPKVFILSGNLWKVVPEGHNENSPAFQRRDEANRRTSPAGTAEIMRPKSRIQPSLRDSKPSALFPALKRRAIFAKSLRDNHARRKPRISERHWAEARAPPVRGWRASVSPLPNSLWPL